MNWREIKEKYPKAVEVLRDTEHYDLAEPRRLYDFFDEQGLHISINYDNRLFSNLITNENSETEGDYWVDAGYDYPTRTEAEEQAFIKAFEILEAKL